MFFLEVSHLSCQIGKNFSLQDISFHLKKGECLHLLGPNGAGKSTLLRLLSKQGPSFQGQVFFEGRNLNQYKPSLLFRKMYYLPQNSTQDQLTGFTVFRTLLLARFPWYNPLRGWTKEDKDHVFRSAEELDLLTFLDRDCSTLSSGEFQKVLFCQALVQEADLLLLDEPWSFLDLYHKREFEKNLSGLLKKGKSVILVTHSLEGLLKKDPMILGLKKGRAVCTGTLSESLQTGALQDLFDVPFRKISQDKYTWVVADE